MGRSRSRQFGSVSLAALAATLCLLFPAPGSAATVSSTFDVDAEGWTVIGDAVGAPAPQYVASGGNPGGFIRTQDANTGGVIYWIAPAKFLADKAIYYGGTLRFDLLQTVLTNQFDDEDVILQGGGLTLSFDTAANPAASWTPYTVSLSESGWLVQGSSPLRAPTRAEFIQVLRSLTALRIRAEYSEASGDPDVDQADNVVLQTGPDTDGDGLPDPLDACPSVGASTPSGCPLVGPVITPPVNPTPTAKPAGPPPPPVLGRRVNVEPVNGEVFVSLPGGAARASATVPGLKGRNFVPLREARQVPVGSILDTRRGTVRLTTASSTPGQTQSADFLSGVFQVLQSRRRSARGLSELRLKGSSFRSCGRSRRATSDSSNAGASALSRRTIRRLRGRGRGRFRTRGRYSAATVRGTDWTVFDRCDGTLTKVRRGRVAVRDVRRRKTILLRAGMSYLARALR